MQSMNNLYRRGSGYLCLVNVKSNYCRLNPNDSGTFIEDNKIFTESSIIVTTSLKWRRYVHYELNERNQYRSSKDDTELHDHPVTVITYVIVAWFEESLTFWNTFVVTTTFDDNDDKRKWGGRRRRRRRGGGGGFKRRRRRRRREEF